MKREMNQSSDTLRIITTSNEFHVRNGVCVAVRERAKGLWLEDHYALGERIALEPRSRRRGRLSRWTAIVSMWGFQVEVGPVLAVEPTNDDDLPRRKSGPTASAESTLSHQPDQPLSYSSTF